MYRLLVVDDEPEVAEGILDILDELQKEDVEFCSAYSAAEALDVLGRTRIDIVLTDIRMPEMDGLAMYEEIKKRWPRCKVIFISGVRDFDYVYQSIQNRDVRYLTKMEPDEKIRQTVLDVIREIEQNALLHDALQQAKQYYNQALPLLRDQYLISLLEGSCPLGEITQDKFDELNITLKTGSPVLLFGLCVDSREEREEPGERQAPGDDQKYLLYSLQAVCQDAVRDFTSRFCCCIEHPFLIWMVQFPTRTETPDTASLRDTVFEQIQKGCRTNLKRTVSIAYSREPALLSNLSASYSAVRQTLGYGRYRFSEGIWDTGMQRSNGKEGPVPNAQTLLRNFPALESSLELGGREEFHAFLREMTDCLRPLPKDRSGPALEVYYRVAILLLKYLNLWSLNESAEARIPLDRLLHPECHESWDRAVEYLTKLSDVIMDLRVQREREQSLDTIYTVKEYIHSNLHCDLSLTALSNVAHLHPSYLSRLFKETTGKNLNRYIVELRMDLAKQLLHGSHEKIQVIAQKTGYVTPQTFNRAFKKFTGVTPNEYRLQNAGSAYPPAL